MLVWKTLFSTPAEMLLALTNGVDYSTMTEEMLEYVLEVRVVLNQVLQAVCRPNDETTDLDWSVDEMLALKSSWDALLDVPLSEKLSTTLYQSPLVKSLNRCLVEYCQRQKSQNCWSSQNMPTTSTSYMTAHGMDEHALVNSGEEFDLKEGLEEALIGSETLDMEESEVFCSTSVWNQGKSVTHSCPTKVGKYYVQLRVMDGQQMKKMPKKEWWKARVKEMFFSITNDVSLMSQAKLKDLINDVTEKIKKNPNMKVEVKQPRFQNF